MDWLVLTAERCVWLLVLSEKERRVLLKKLSTGEYVLVWDEKLHEFVLYKVE